jgi:hypothetical protein
MRGYFFSLACVKSDHEKSSSSGSIDFLVSQHTSRRDRKGQ